MQIVGDLQILRREESEHLEFKQDVPSLAETVRIISAFAETAGGALLIGLNSNGEVLGISDQAAVEATKRFREALSGLLFEGEWRLGLERFGGRTIAFVEVQPGQDEVELITDAFKSYSGRRLTADASPVNVAVLGVGTSLGQALRSDPALIHKLNPDQFEEFICDRLDAMGLDARRMGHLNRKDGGIDVLFWPRVTCSFPFLGVAQVKHHREGVRQGAPDIRDFAGAIAGRPFGAALFVTNTTFTPDAIWFAQQQSLLMRLRDFDDLYRWIRNDFASEHEWREIPRRLEIAPGVIVEIPRGPRK